MTSMTPETPAIEIEGLVRRFGRTEAVKGLSVRVERGRCYGFFGRNGAGKTTTIKCLLNLLRPTRGTVRVFRMDPARNEVEVKSSLAYVPDSMAFYPWMTVRDTLDYVASFRRRWNADTERALLDRFQLDLWQTTSHLSKGQRTQLALTAAICGEPDLLVLDEPTSGLDPIVRREFIQTVIGAYQDADPGKRTVFVSTHLIAEFEGLIDRFTIIEQGREVRASACRALAPSCCSCGTWPWRIIGVRTGARCASCFTPAFLRRSSRFSWRCSARSASCCDFRLKAEATGLSRRRVCGIDHV
jgi:ABC-2 type transport system ATP-binding protein